MAGLREEIADSVEQVLAVLERGEGKPLYMLRSFGPWQKIYVFLIFMCWQHILTKFEIVCGCHLFFFLSVEFGLLTFFFSIKCRTAQRHFAETNMNVNSSRSHTIFRMVNHLTSYTL